MSQETRTSLLVDLAQDYYLNQLNLGEISQKYNISRYKISKYLTEAVDKKIVSINISSPFLRANILEDKLHIIFPYLNFFILKSGDNISHANDSFYSFTAKYLQDLIEDKESIGLTWGDTLYHVIDSFQAVSKSNTIFTQFIGENVKHSPMSDSLRLVQMAANKYNSQSLTIDAPLYIMNKQVHKLLAIEPAIKSTLDVAKNLDLIFSSIGTLDSLNSIDTWKNNRQEIFPNIDSSSIAALVYGRPIDKNGDLLIDSANDKIFGLSLSDTLKIPTRVAIVNDKFKSAALQAALKGNYFTDIFLDEPTANKLLTELSIPKH